MKKDPPPTGGGKAAQTGGVYPRNSPRRPEFSHLAATGYRSRVVQFHLAAQEPDNVAGRVSKRRLRERGKLLGLSLPAHDLVEHRHQRRIHGPVRAVLDPDGDTQPMV